MAIEDNKKRAKIVEILDACNQRAVWPGRSLSHDLKKLWQRGDGTES
jgi:hypothetical protein